MSTSQIPYRSNRSTGTDATRSVNDLGGGFVSRHLNRYNLSKRVLTSGRFGQVYPVDCLECYPGLTVSTAPEVNLMMDRPLSSPLMSNVFMHRFGSYVPSQAIYPNSWEFLKSIPLHDSEAPADARSFWTADDDQLLRQFLLGCYNVMTPTSAPKYPLACLAMYCFALLFNSQSDLVRMGCSLFQPAAFDAIMDAFYKASPNASFYEGLTFLDLSRVDGYFKEFDQVKFIKALTTADFATLVINSGLNSAVKVNLEPLFALRLLQNEFFVSDVVDDIYDSKRWYSVFNTAMVAAFDSFATYTPVDYYSFEYEGSNVMYDACSHHWLHLFMTSLSAMTPTDTQNFRASIVPLMLLAVPTYALKLGDYFTGSRLSPLAVGDGDFTSVESTSTGNGVKTISINQNLLMLRLRQYINRIGSRAVEQSKALFGIAPSEGNTRPKFIFHHKSALGKNLVVQTGASVPAEGEEAAKPLGTYAMNMTANPDREANMFSFLCDDFGYYFTLIFFDTRAFYINASQRLFFKTDKYDFFDPMLQNFGDDQIFQGELAADAETLDLPFGFAPRYNDLRQRFDQVDGPFVRNKTLQSWFLNITEDDDPDHSNRFYTLNPRMLRLLPYYFDRLFKSFVPSFGNDYHFLLDVKINVDVLSPVSIDPNILF